MNKAAIEDRMREKRISVRGLCREIGIDTSTWYRKMQKNGETFNAYELSGIKRVLELSNDQAVDMLLS